MNDREKSTAISGVPASALSRASLERLALTALILGAAGIAFSPIFVRLSELDPTATAFYRVFLAFPALYLFSAVEAKKAPVRTGPANGRDRMLLILAGVFFACDLAFWHWSIRFTSVANSTLLSNFAPIFVTLGSFILFGQRFSKRFLFGLVLAMAGAAVLMGGSLIAGGENFLGDILGLITAVFYAGYILTVGRLRARLSAAVIMSWSSASAAVILLPVTLLAGEGLIAETLYGWSILLGLALISHAAGQGLIAYALAHLPAAFSSVGLLAQPAIAAVLAWIIFGEALGPWQGLGAAVVLAGIWQARQGSK